MIKCNEAFVLCANASVKYDGRASSLLKDGNYLIIHKLDGSLMVHGATLCSPLNYQQPGAVLSGDDHMLISKRKNEYITITINRIISYNKLDDWSDNKIEIHGTEAEIQENLVKNLDKYIHDIYKVSTSYATDIGSIDILAVGNNMTKHIIEVKRKRAGVPVVYQLQRYMEFFAGDACCGYIAAPGIVKKALDLMKVKGYKYIEIS